MVKMDMTNPGLIQILSELKSWHCSVNKNENDKNILDLLQNNSTCPEMSTGLCMKTSF